MNQLYRTLGISKQGFHQWKKRQSLKSSNQLLVLEILDQVREDHPGMGVRSIWELMRPPIGREEFEYIAFMNGLGVQTKKNFRRTTDSRGVTRFPNLLKDLKLTHVNQVWVSDITYYRMQERFYYLTFIMDLLSRKVIGYSVSSTLEMKSTTIPALQYAIKMREGMPRKETIIFHSDGGGQYYGKAFRSLLKSNDMVSSMGTNVYENPNVERLHRTLKNQYIYLYAPNTERELRKDTARACVMYNQKPHRALDKKTPNAFERLRLSTY